MAKAFPEDIGGVTPGGSPKPIGQEGQQKPPEKPFESYMDENVPGTEKPEGPSPMELPEKAGTGTGPTMDSIHEQMQKTSDSLGNVHDQLSTKNLKLKQSQKYLLRNKLSDANTDIRAAAEKAGVDTGKAPSRSTRQNPIARFLALVTDGQQQLGAAARKIQSMNAEGKAMSPGDLLLTQVKLSKAQQEIEYSSVILSKAIDNIKMLFNIQL